MNRAYEHFTAWALLGLVASLTSALGACGANPAYVVPLAGGSGGGAGESPGGAGGAAGAQGGRGAEGGSVEFACGVSSSYEPACVSCVDEHCCEDAALCALGPDCEAYLACRHGCEPYDMECSFACELAHPDASRGDAMIIVCEMRYCAEACGWPADTAPCGAYYVEEGCNACAQERCCDELYVSAHERDGWELRACWNACATDDLPCQNECTGQHPEGYAANLLSHNCVASECTGECEELFDPDVPCGLMTPQYVSGSEECRDCAEAECCEASEQASASEELYRYFACYYGCAEEEYCIRDCAIAHAGGIGLTNAAEDCVGTECYAECLPVAPWLAPCGNVINLDPVCNSCMQALCCAEFTALGTSPEGMAYLTCVNNAYTWEQYSQCVADWPDGYVLTAQVTACQGDPERCSAWCPWAPRPCGFDFSPLATCDTCMQDPEQSACCSAAEACANDFDCARLELCRVLHNCALGDEPCLDECRAAYPNGVEEADALYACLTGDCGAECAGW